MPLPLPKQGEAKDAFVARCVASDAMVDEYGDDKQRLAVCFSQWERAQEQKDMSVNDKLLKVIRSRQQKQTEFAYGILTADRYVQTLSDVAGFEVCYRYGCQGHVSFNDALEKAAKTLVYSNPDMVLLDKARDQYSRLSGERDLPKNTLMVFRHVLTTSRKDRDGDVLHADGMETDPKMLLLWQHVHTMPIGKMLAEVDRTKDKLILDSCIIDINDLSHDAAVMIDNDMGRFSHGFRALEFQKIKAEDGSDSGFDITKGEIMEESLVSVPANPDSETEQVLLSLVEGKKLTSPLMKEVGKGIRERLPVTVPVKLDVKMTINGQEVEDENKSGDRKEEGGGETGTSEKADEGGGKEGKQKPKPEDKEVKCPKCGSTDIEDGVCQDCGYKMPPSIDSGKDADGQEKESFDCECLDCGHQVTSSKHCDELECPECGGEMRRAERPGPGKAGRVISGTNESKIRDAKADIDEVLKSDQLDRTLKATLRQASRTLDAVLASLGTPTQKDEGLDVADVANIVLQKFTAVQRQILADAIGTIREVDKQEAEAAAVNALMGIKFNPNHGEGH